MTRKKGSLHIFAEGSCVIEKHPFLFVAIAYTLSIGIIYLSDCWSVRKSLFILLAMGIAFLWSIVLKQIFNIRREHYNHRVKLFTPRFPSLHTAVAYAGALSTVYVLGEMHPWSWIVLIAAVYGASSRLVGKYHKLNEIMAGSIVGWGSCLIASVILIM